MHTLNNTNVIRCVSKGKGCYFRWPGNWTHFAVNDVQILKKKTVRKRQAFEKYFYYLAFFCHQNRFFLRLVLLFHLLWTVHLGCQHRKYFCNNRSSFFFLSFLFNLRLVCIFGLTAMQTRCASFANRTHELPWYFCWEPETLTPADRWRGCHQGNSCREVSAGLWRVCLTTSLTPLSLTVCFVLSHAGLGARALLPVSVPWLTALLCCVSRQRSGANWMKSARGTSWVTDHL